MKKIEKWKFTDKEIETIKNEQLNIDDSEMFLHCKECLQKFLGSPSHSTMTPSEAMEYEASAVPLTYPNGKTALVVVIWCKRCGKKVWDSRHLTHLY